MSANKSFVVRRSRPGLGRGLFAKRDFGRGKLVTEFTGKRISTAEADALKTRYLFEVDHNWTIDGSTRDNVARYINHSCEPNCEADVRNGRVFVDALWDIPAGEELTIDYGDEYFDEYIRPGGCKCSKCYA